MYKTATASIPKIVWSFKLPSKTDSSVQCHQQGTLSVDVDDVKVRKPTQQETAINKFHK